MNQQNRHSTVKKNSVEENVFISNNLNDVWVEFCRSQRPAKWSKKYKNKD